MTPETTVVMLSPFVLLVSLLAAPLLFLPSAKGELATSKKEVLADLYVAPIVQFRLEAGSVREDQVLVNCVQQTDERRYPQSHIDQIKTLRCENGVVLVLDNISFDTQPKVVLRVSKIIGEKQ